MFTFTLFQRVRRALVMSLGVATTLFLTAGVAQTKPVTVTITQLDQIGEDFDFNSLGDFYAKVTINGAAFNTYDQRLNFPGGITTGFIVPSGPLIPNPPWILTQEIPSTSGLVPVHIEIFDADDGPSDNQADINPASGKETIDIMVDLTTGKWSGDVNWPQSCVSGPLDPDFDNNSVAVCFDISVFSATGDADGDGLLDSWEQNGFNADGDGIIDFDLPAFGANPLRKDVFVEVDYLQAATHSHAPRQDAIADIVQSFANAPVTNLDGTTGVQLHVDVGSLYGQPYGTSVSLPGKTEASGTYGNFGGGGTPIPEAGHEIIQAFTGAKGSATKFADLKSQWFDSRRQPIFRYAIFGHQTNYRHAANDCTSGIGDSIPGHDFLVTLGGVRDSSAGPPCWDTDANGFSVGDRTRQGGTFQHELGHTLGLQHGGNEGLPNDKPNYLSVMNYSFQFCDIKRSPNGQIPGGCDYSRIELPTLDETNLDECVGIDGGLGYGSYDWNGNGPIEGATCTTLPNVIADVNNDGVCIIPGGNNQLDSTPTPDDVTKFDSFEMVMDGPNRVCNTTAVGDDVALQIVGLSPTQTDKLTGWDDWGHLTYSPLASAGSGGGGGLPVENEADPDTIRQSREYLGTLLAPGIVVAKTGPATAKPGDVLNYTTKISNQGHGPALEVVLTDRRPDGGTQATDLGAIVLGSSKTQTSSFTVPANACPGDYIQASASAAFKDFVNNQLTASGSTPLQILDVAPPTLTVSVSPTTLWPPNHKFQDVTATITVQDNCDPHPTVTLVSITSSEPATGVLGNGDQGPDIHGAAIGTDDRSFSLRSERDTGHGSTGRVYTIVYRAKDNSGNTSDKTVTVTVPANNSGH